MNRLTLAVLAIASVVMNAPAFAQSQGSDEAANYALSWRAVGGGYAGVSNTYARARFAHPSYRWHWR
jgi:hypothetical protein